MALNTQLVNALTEVTVFLSSGESAVTYLSLCNFSASPVTLDVHLCPGAAAAGTGNIIISQLTIAADDSYVIYGAGEKIILSDGDAIKIIAGTASAVTAVTSYVGV
jgi:hypothetical protein